MISSGYNYELMLNSPARRIKARVELLDGSTLLNTFKYSDALQDFTVERVGESNKFFGFGICQKLTLKLRDRERAINVVKGNRLDVAFGVDGNYIYTCPIFFVDEVTRDENTNNLTIIAYDSIYEADKNTISKVGLPTSYTIKEIAYACAGYLGMPIKFINVDNYSLNLYYPNGANFDGNETIREVLNDIAEATQTIYYMDSEWNLVFKRLDKDGDPVLNIDKSLYFTLTCKGKYNLEEVVRATELGDNVSASTGNKGETQYVRDNAFWELRDDIADILNNALNAVSGLTLNVIDCKWRGNFLLEIGDKISVVTKDNNIVTTYILDDTITYNGGFIQKTRCDYAENKNNENSNPNTIGEYLTQTYAKVDKVNKKIDLVASEIDENSKKISNIEVTTDTISSSVTRVENNTNGQVNLINKEIETLTSKVNSAMTADEIKFEISQELSNGINKVNTSTGYTFDDTGLTISKTNSEMKTLITEDGMKVSRNDIDVLIANNQGVQATNLHATTYLIIGTYSRFEDFNGKTGCFWIGP